MSGPKFEEQFRTEMQNREIKPSAKSWEQLQARLEEGGKTSVYKRYWWRGAAAVIGGIAIAGVLFTNSPGQDPAVVEISPDKIPAKEEPGIRENRQQVSEQTQIRKSEESSIAKTLSQDNESFGQEKERTLASGREGERETPGPATGETETLLEAIIEQDSGGLLAEASSGESQIQEVTDAEIDALLARAEREIRQEERFAGNLEADELLRIVETEMEQSFRAKVFEILKDGFQKTRTAVVNRNHPSQ